MVYGDGIYGNGAKVFASLFHFWHHNPVTTFSLCLFAHAYHVELHLRFSSSLYKTVVLLMYMKKIVCSNTDSDQE